MATVDFTKRTGSDRRAFLRLSECAAILGISTRQAYRWAEAGRLPTVDLGGERGRFVPARSLAALLSAQAELAIESLATDGYRVADEARKDKGAGG